jgi:hypothetical protein
MPGNLFTQHSFNKSVNHKQTYLKRIFETVKAKTLLRQQTKFVNFTTNVLSWNSPLQSAL